MDTTINIINDRILRVSGQLTALTELRAELLSVAGCAVSSEQRAASVETVAVGGGRKAETGPVNGERAAAGMRVVRYGEPAPAPRRKAQSGTVAELVIKAIAEEPAEFSTSGLCSVNGMNEGGRNYKAITSTLSRLRRHGKIRQVRQGWWEKTPLFEAPAGLVATPKEREYATFRESLKLKVPDIQGAAPAQH